MVVILVGRMGGFGRLRRPALLSEAGGSPTLILPSGPTYSSMGLDLMWCDLLELMFRGGAVPMNLQQSMRSHKVAGLFAAAVLFGLGVVTLCDEPKRPESAKAPSVEPERLTYPDMETDAAFAGTWQLVQKSGDEGGTKVGDRLVVEERIVEYGTYKGATVWDWHQPGPQPRVLTHWSSFVNWGPTRTAAKPWPIIELKRGPSNRTPPSRAIYHLDGDVLRLAFAGLDGRLPVDFETGGGGVEIWRRVMPPVARLEPESALDGRWRLVSVEFHAFGSFGPAANTSVPEHLVGTKGPDWFLKAEEGKVFDVEDGSWREETWPDAGVAWTAIRRLALPRRIYRRSMVGPRPAGVPAEEDATYRLGTVELVLRFHQQWLETHPDGVSYLDTGERIETYERLTPGARPVAR
jgi:hypothetical protein